MGYLSLSRLRRRLRSRARDLRSTAGMLRDPRWHARAGSGQSCVALQTLLRSLLLPERCSSPATHARTQHSKILIRRRPLPLIGEMRKLAEVRGRGAREKAGEAQALEGFGPFE